MILCCGFRHRMGPDGTLVIRNMEEKDRGVYHCLASNLAGTDTTNSILTYIGELHIHTWDLYGSFSSAEPAHTSSVLYH